jgi:Cdc6-like AAA superfamily ATPase
MAAVLAPYDSGGMANMDDRQKLTLKAQLSTSFRPGAPIDKYDLFAGRMSQVNDVINAIIQPGQHVILFGERGVGKTSLAKVISEVLQRAGFKLLDSGTINCDGKDTFSSLWHKVFRELSIVLSSRQTGFVPEGSEPGLKVSLESLLPEEARPDDVRYVLNHLPHGQGSIIIIDEIDRISDKETATLLADTIKNLSDHATPTTLILVGVADAVDDLIAEHKSIERALTQIPMPRMSSPELTQIIDKGLRAANMTIEDDAKVWITRLSQGLAHYTHSLALYAAQRAVDNDRTHITMAEVNEATKATVEKSHTILSAYNRAVSSPQTQSLYDKVLLACALADKDDLGFFTAAAVSKPMSLLMGRNYPVPNFSRHLYDFCEPKRGRILKKIGGPRRIRYRFIDPLMLPFVMIKGYATGQLTDGLLLKAKGRKQDGKAATS